jgi:hypothetical protein
MRMKGVSLILIAPLLAGCGSLTTDCLSLAPVGIWTKIEPPQLEIVALFDEPDVNSHILWFENRDGMIGMCQSCGPSGKQAKSFQMGLDKQGKKTEKECVL